METLLMSPEHRVGILGEELEGGDKKITIRDRKRPQFEVGDKIHIVSSDNSWGCLTDLTGVDFYTYETIPEQDCIDDGFVSRRHMISGMRRYYPYITPSSEATVLRWGKIHDIWVKA